MPVAVASQSARGALRFWLRKVENGFGLSKPASKPASNSDSFFDFLFTCDILNPGATKFDTLNKLTNLGKKQRLQF